MTSTLAAANQQLHTLTPVVFARVRAGLGNPKAIDAFIHFHGAEPHVHDLQAADTALAEEFLATYANVTLSTLTPAQFNALKTSLAPALQLGDYGHFHGADIHITRPFAPSEAAHAAAFLEARQRASGINIPAADHRHEECHDHACEHEHHDHGHDEHEHEHHHEPPGPAQALLANMGLGHLGKQYDALPQFLNNLLTGKGVQFEDDGSGHYDSYGVHLHRGQPMKEMVAAYGVAALGAMASSHIKGMPYLGQLVLKAATAWPLIYGFIGKELEHAVTHAKHGENMQDLAKYGLMTALLGMGIFKKDDSSLVESAGLMATLLGAAGQFETNFLDEQQKAIDALLEQLPPTAERLSDDGSHAHTVATEELQKGNVLVLKKGDTLPVNATLLTINGKAGGRALVDTYLSSGQPGGRPVDVGHGLMQGALILDNEVTVRVDAPAAESYLRTQLGSIKRDGSTKTQTTLDSVINKYVYLLIAGSLGQTAVSALKPALEGGGFDLSKLDLGKGFEDGAELAIKGSPCSVLVGPVAYGLAQSKFASDHRIIIQDQVALEAAPNTNMLLSDLTGTLTLGRSTVMAQHFCDAKGQPQHATPLLEAVAMLENAAGSEHPIAQAVQRHTQDTLKLPPKPAHEHVKDAEELTGEGVTGTVDGQPMQVGRRSFIERNGGRIPQAVLEQAQAAMEQGQSVTYVRRGNTYGFIALEDPIRPGAVEAIAELREKGVEVRIMTGEAATSALRKAAKLGIAPEHVHAGLLPEDKVNLVAQHRQAGYGVAVVGDGLNDAAAMKRVTQDTPGEKPGIAYALHDTGHKATTGNASIVIPGLEVIPNLMNASKQVNTMAQGSTVLNAAWAGFLSLRHLLLGERLGVAKSTIAHEVPTGLTILGEILGVGAISKGMGIAA